MLLQCVAEGSWTILMYTPANTTAARFSGELQPYAGLNAPVGWLFTDGSAVSRTTNGSLFSALSIQTVGDTTNGQTTVANVGTTTGMVPGMPVCGTNIPSGTWIVSISGNTITLNNAATGNGSQQAFIVCPWGVGNGTTTFNVPDLRGRTLVGLDNMNGNVANVGQISTTITTTVGSNSATVGSNPGLAVGFTISASSVPFGTTITAISGTTITMSANATANNSGISARFSPVADIQRMGSVGGTVSTTLSSSEMPVHSHGITDPGHYHVITTNNVGIGAGTNIAASNQSNSPESPISSTSTTGVTNNNSGGGLAHNIWQPSAGVNIIVKT